MRVTLEATAGPGAGRKILLRTKQVARIGRTQLADYVFQDSYLSGVHFSISFDGRECRLQDLGSSNGTFVNGQQVMEATLKSGDEIGAGACRFSVAIDLSGPHRSPAALAPAAAEPAPAPAAERPAATIEAPMSRATAELPSTMARPIQTRTQPLPRPSTDLPDRYRRGLADEEPAVRRAALFAAVWTRQGWIVRHLARLAASPSPEHLDLLRMFALLAEPSQLNAVLSLVRNTALGPERFELAGLLGHPALVKDLLTAMSWQDAGIATAAAAAFEKITGAEVTSPDAAETSPDQTAAAPTSGVEAAHEFWRTEGARFSRAARWSRGRDVSRPINNEALLELDLETRWEVLLRDHFYRRRDVSLAELELLGPVE
jgi:hypothetical protein